MTTTEALNAIEYARECRRVEDGNNVARAHLLLDAARIANDDTAVGNPHEILASVASPTLTYRHRMQWFATLIEETASLARYKAWRDRTASCHHVASAALNEVIAQHTDRAVVAVTVLLGGIPSELAA